MEILKLIITTFVVHNVCATATPNDFIYEPVKLEGPCPYITYITNYDMNSVLGWWYRLYSESSNPLCYKNQGHTMYAIPYNNVTIHVEICCRNKADPSVAICGSVVGSGDATAGSRPGTLTYHFQNKTYPTYVLYNDYKSAGIAYACKQGTTKNERDEIVFILSRGYKLDHATENEVNDVLRRNGIRSLSSLIPIKQGDDIPQTAGPSPNQGKV